jgi:hypothetical protein
MKISRRSRTVLLAGFLLPLFSHHPAQAQGTPPAEAFRVLPLPGLEAPQMTPLLLYQTALAWQQDGRRQARWSQVKTEEDLKRLRSELRRSVLDMIGGLPTEKTPLHPVITGRIVGRGFHIEKLLYQSLPGLYVTALVYLPDDGQKRHPAILVPAGHAENGKIHYQELAQRLVQRGYIVFSWDPIGQGERSQFWDAKAQRSRYNLICAEHAVMGNLAYLAGASLARWEVWDGIRGVDYLLSRPDVDGARLSVTGTSGGGFQAAMLGALDERIRVIIPSCYITALPMRMENRIFVDPDSDPEQDLDGFLSRGVDHAGLLLLMYPRAVMVATATLDFFPIQGAHKAFDEVHDFYQRFGRGDRMAFVESYNEHQYSLQNQEAALHFLDRFNFPSRAPHDAGLPVVNVYPDTELRVTPTGQISVDHPDSKPLLRFIAEYLKDKPRTKQTLAAMYHASGDPHISAWTVARYDGSAAPGTLQWEAIGTSQHGAFHIDRYLLHHSTNLNMPLLHFHGDNKPAKGSVLWFSLHGHARDADWPAIAPLLRDGYDVFSFDFRGLGETRMNYRARSEDDPNLVTGDFDHAYMSPLSSVLAGYVYNSVLTGRPYFLQMLDDIRIAQLFIRDRAPHEPVLLAPSSDAYGVASRFRQVDPTAQLLPSSAGPDIDWSHIVDTGQQEWPIMYLVPGAASLQK